MSLAQKTISFKALQRCRTTIEDFVCTYFPLYGLNPSKDLFKYLDILLFVEATIYQMDEENEALCEALCAQEPNSSSSSSGRGAGGGSNTQQHTFQGASVLEEVLEQQKLLSDRVAAELRAGQQYWQQERRFCAELARLQPGHPERLTLADILATHELKSFDYRVMHLLLLELLQQQQQQQPPPKPAPADSSIRPAADDSSSTTLLEFMRLDEFLIDIGDDLTDYEDDVVANSFNIFRGYVYLFGQEAPLKLAERISRLEAQRAQLLQQLPSSVAAHVVKRQQDAVEEEGADKWVFPVVILDEVKFRRDVAAEGQA